MNTVQDAPAKKRGRLLLIGGVTLAAIIAIASFPRVPQDEAYHTFADQRTLLGVQNLLNVLSNLAFLFVGIAGVLYVARPNSQSSFYQPSERAPYLVFFLAWFCFRPVSINISLLRS